MLNARDIVNQFLSILSSYFSIEENNGLGTSVLTTRDLYRTCRFQRERCTRNEEMHSERRKEESLVAPLASPTTRLALVSREGKKVHESRDPAANNPAILAWRETLTDRSRAHARLITRNARRLVPPPFET